RAGADHGRDYRAHRNRPHHSPPRPRVRASSRSSRCTTSTDSSFYRATMTDTLPRLVLFSGLGVDETLFAPQRSLPARIEVVPWVSVDGSGSLSDYARRLAATIAPAADGPLYLGGVSFGAMLALEAASVLRPRPRGVFLIA